MSRGMSNVLVKSLIALSWPGIRNTGEAADSRRRNGLNRPGAAVHQKDVLLFDVVGRSRNSQESQRLRRNAEPLPPDATDRCRSQESKWRRLVCTRRSNYRAAFAN